ncbi:hypothetical protein [Helicobacter canis]|uniref:hypothetical protein n=1 Tax=Helicobacter canis TaxID=29419 RepID=UPI000E0F8F41|nr:hypothetical protein [Helicobacter canis]
MAKRSFFGNPYQKVDSSKAYFASAEATLATQSPPRLLTMTANAANADSNERRNDKTCHSPFIQYHHAEFALR